MVKFLFPSHEVEVHCIWMRILTELVISLKQLNVLSFLSQNKDRSEPGQRVRIGISFSTERRDRRRHRRGGPKGVTTEVVEVRESNPIVFGHRGGPEYREGEVLLLLLENVVYPLSRGRL